MNKKHKEQIWEALEIISKEEHPIFVYYFAIRTTDDNYAGIDSICISKDSIFRLVKSLIRLTRKENFHSFMGDHIWDRDIKPRLEKMTGWDLVGRWIR